MTAHAGFRSTAEITLTVLAAGRDAIDATVVGCRRRMSGPGLRSGHRWGSARKRPLRFGLALAALFLLAAPAMAGEIIFVNGTRAEDVRYEGKAWTPDGRCLVGAGAGQALFAVPRLGAGDFVVRVWLRIDRLPGSGAAVRFGPNRFGFAGADRASNPFLAGPGFTSGATTPHVLTGMAEPVPGGRFFAFEAARSGHEIVFRINGQEAARIQPGAGDVGEIGLEPGRATMRVYRFSVQGSLEQPEERAARDAGEERRKFAEAVDRAIDRGVRYLLDGQLRDGNWNYSADRYPTGQTALSVYTLLKSGLPPAHPAVRRGLIAMAQVRPAETYTLSLHLMALQATHDESHRIRMQPLLDDLLGWTTNGSWGYGPGRSGNGRTVGRPDLSNTQFAALGLRAAQLAGLKVPARTWSALLRATLGYQTAVEQLDVPWKPGLSRTYRMPARGFGYVTGRGPATGSMTAAGVATLRICRDGLGRKLSQGEDRSSRQGLDLGLNWLAGRFSVSENPGRPGWVHYYLYGLERVGSLLGREHIGDRDWYQEGARQLVKTQNARGSWRGGAPDPSTCFALLFLRRATRPTPRAEERRVARYAGDTPESGVGLRGFGLWPMRIWITGFGPKVLETHGVDVDGKRQLRVSHVDYLVDGEVVATVEGKPRIPWAGESFLIEHHLARAGRRRVSARIHLVEPEVAMGRIGSTVVVEAPGFEVRMRDAYEPWMARAAEARSRNLLRDRSVKVQASSSSGRNRDGARAVDGDESTAWVCNPSDREPRITLSLGTSIRARSLVLGQAASSRRLRASFDRIEQVEVRINDGKRPLAVTLASNSLEPTVVELPRNTRVRKIQIDVVRRASAAPVRRPGPRGRRARGVGFAEIRLERE